MTFWLCIGTFLLDKHLSFPLLFVNVPAGFVVSGVPAKVISTDSNKCFNKKWDKEYAHSYNE